MVDEIGDLGGAVVRIDRHAAHADAVEGQRMQHMLGPILEQRCDAVADAVARLPVECRQFLDRLPGLAVRHLEARWQIGAVFIGGHGQKRAAGMRGNRRGKRCSDGRTVHDLGHDILVAAPARRRMLWHRLLARLRRIRRHLHAADHITPGLALASTQSTHWNDGVTWSLTTAWHSPHTHYGCFPHRDGKVFRFRIRRAIPKGNVVTCETRRVSAACIEAALRFEASVLMLRCETGATVHRARALLRGDYWLTIAVRGRHYCHLPVPDRQMAIWRLLQRRAALGLPPAIFVFFQRARYAHCEP